MDLTYMVRGADGKEYGPATLEQLSGWVQEGRVPAKQEIKRSDIDYWVPAGDYSELQPAFGISSPAGAPAAPVAATGTGTQTAPAATLQRQAGAVALVKSGGSWFYWIAGLSLINSISAFAGSTWRFIVGLGITQVFDAFGHSLGTGGKGVVLALDLLAAGLFILFGVFAVKGHAWAFIVGMVLFALDGLVFLLVKDWIGVGFHVFVLYCLFRGFSASRQIRQS